MGRGLIGEQVNIKSEMPGKRGAVFLNIDIVKKNRNKVKSAE